MLAMLPASLVQAQAESGQAPNVLWILTDDHRYDSIRAFNQMLHGREMSELGYVESPNTDRLAKMGTTFINTYCQAQGCAPSRASMHYGRYPFRSGICEFEYHNNNAEHCKPTLPESMAELGYQTTHVDSGMILAGVSSREAGKTRDGYYASIFADYLKNPNRKFKVGSREYDGVDTSKPLFCHIGFDFPHTPVLPPADYRKRFQQHTYKVPKLHPQEMKSMPKQLKKMVSHGFSDHFTDAEKQAMVQDYYAFCAYGDTLVGQAADAFIEYSESQKQPWTIVYVCGDHGWKLNEHRSVSKFTPWDVDAHNPIIVVSSDKQKFPADKVVTDFTEFVDIAPTILSLGGADIDGERFNYLDGFSLADTAAGTAPVRDYVIGESHAVTGPRAFIRTKDYVFSMQTRPNTNRGKEMEWALTASYKELDPALYHMPSDPHEVNNQAFSPEHERMAMIMKDKLMNIVLGDNRVEVDWGGNKALGTTVFRSNFAPGADDKQLDLP